MRILILGAGAIGAYYGAHLIEAGADVTFLVRPRRAGQLAEDGLVVHTGGREIRMPVKVVETPAEQADLILLACKAYDLDAAIAAIAPAVGPATLIVPILNGIAHFDALDARFAAENVLGGVCMISITLEANGHIRHFGTADTMLFGNRFGAPQASLLAFAALFAKTPVTAKVSTEIVQDLWDKWSLLSAGGTLTCLLRGNVAQIMATRDGPKIAAAVAEECRALCAKAGHDPRPATFARTRAMLTDPKSPFITSMRRDLDNKAPKIEADHILGDLLRRGEGVAAPFVTAAYCQLQVYGANLPAN